MKQTRRDLAVLLPALLTNAQNGNGRTGRPKSLGTPLLFGGTESVPIALAAAGKSAEGAVLLRNSRKTGTAPSAPREESASSFAASGHASAPFVLPSKCYSYDSLPEKTNPQTGNESRQVFDGETHKGMQVDLHLTKLAPGQMPHPEHHHTHEEVVMMRTGQIEATIAGRTCTVHAGSVIYVASDEPHHWKNTGKEPAEYFVIALARDKT